MNSKLAKVRKGHPHQSFIFEQTVSLLGFTEGNEENEVRGYSLAVLIYTEETEIGAEHAKITLSAPLC